jgi:hypothetical protein
METFVVRVWSPVAGEQEESGLRGVVEHVSSGVSDRFRSVEELVSFLRSPGPGTDKVSLATEEGGHSL